MSHQDHVFKQTFAIILAILAAMAVVFYIIAHTVIDASGTQNGQSEMAQKATEERIQPVGQVTAADLSSGAAAGRSGKDVIAASCGGCHIAGVAGAPKIGSKADWEPRAKAGIDAMLKVAVEGKGAMPPRGGGDFTDEELKAAIEIMVKDSGL